MFLSPGKGPVAEGGGAAPCKEAPKQQHRRNCTTFTMYQLHQLERAFEASHYPFTAMRSWQPRCTCQRCACR